VAREKRRHADHTDSWLKTVVNEYACAIDPDQIDYVLEGVRAEKASPEAAQLFIHIIETAQRQPFADGKPALVGLCDLVKGNPAFKEEARRVEEFVSNGESLSSHQFHDRAGFSAAEMPLQPVCKSSAPRGFRGVFLELLERKRSHVTPFDRRATSPFSPL
jgi:hypothetical protein